MKRVGSFLGDWWRLVIPYFRSGEWPYAIPLVIGAVALTFTGVGLEVLFNDWNRRFYDSLQNKDEAAFWREISDVWPDSLILLSTRTDAAAWFKSADATIFNVVGDEQQLPPEMQPFARMWGAIATNTFTPNFRDRDAAMAAYDAHNAAVRAEADPARLVEWQAQDGAKRESVEVIAVALRSPRPHLTLRRALGR